MKDRAAVIAPPPLLMVLAIGAGLLADHFAPFAIVPGVGAARFVLFGFLLLIATAFIVSGLADAARRAAVPAAVIERPARSLSYALSETLSACGRDARSPLRFGVVKAEERYLSAKFGDTYDDYRRRVRRWI